MIDRLKGKNVGLWIALSALAVNGPRFVLVFLEADGVILSHVVTGPLLGLTGIATGLVLTGGGAYIAHTIAEEGRPPIVRFVLSICWACLLIFTVVLLAPAMTAAAKTSSLAEVLTTARLQWAWAIAAVVSVEVLAAGAMVAHAMGQVTSQGHGPSRITKALTNRIVSILEGPQAPQEAPERTAAATQAPKPVLTPQERQDAIQGMISDQDIETKTEFLAALGEALGMDTAVNQSTVSESLSDVFGTSKKTSSRDLDKVWDVVAVNWDSDLTLSDIPDPVQVTVNGNGHK